MLPLLLINLLWFTLQLAASVSQQASFNTFLLQVFMHCNKLAKYFLFYTELYWNREIKTEPWYNVYFSTFVSDFPQAY